MPRSHTHLTLTPEQLKELESFMEEMMRLRPRQLKARRRAQAIWYSHQGWSVQEISQALKAPPRTIWRWLAAYQRAGVNGLIDQRLRAPISRGRTTSTIRPREPKLLTRGGRTKQIPQPAEAAGKIMTPAEVATYLKISRAKVYRLVKAGQLPGVKIGRAWRFRKADIHNLLIKTTWQKIYKRLRELES